MAKEPKAKQLPTLEISLDIPDDTPEDKVRELVKQTVLRADMTHRAYGGHGLKVVKVETSA